MNMEHKTPLSSRQTLMSMIVRVSPLITIRHTSQVCQHWRNLILQLPMIWANIVDLDVLRQKKGTCRTEVLRRTGTATLCISGTVYWKKSSRTQPFLCLLLKEHWERIQNLDIDVVCLGSGDPPTIIKQMRKRPAPKLEFISVCHPLMGSQVRGSLFKKIYEGSEPKG
ncbi:hypothetical protein CPB84DRAFT_620941 [Gymnopilus junonius]|uniref:F-box domain-containing protein n=1 Tax=Gymnopilus junonius TaxID=109634 RepID=A0A9P5TF81_GYMJU|nr:hypothetical protein CPB84DRAFT_620941 [Gymnopilus junonius]